MLFSLEGATHLHYLKHGENVILSCRTCQWEADVDSDIRVDCNFLRGSSYATKSECPAGKPDLCKEIKTSSSNACQISVNRGSFACVSEFQSETCFMFPFKSSAYYVESFIVAQEGPNTNSKCEFKLCYV